MAKKTYYATRNVDCGKRYQHGEPIELEEGSDVAKGLLDCGAIVEKKPQGAEQSAGPGNHVQAAAPAKSRKAKGKK